MYLLTRGNDPKGILWFALIGIQLQTQKRLATLDVSVENPSRLSVAGNRR